MGKNEEGPFATLFTWVGLIAGAAAGWEAGEFGGMCVGAFFLAVVGYWIGRMADTVLIWVLFVVGSIISLLINSAIRRFLWELLTSGS